MRRCSSQPRPAVVVLTFGQLMFALLPDRIVLGLAMTYSHGVQR